MAKRVNEPTDPTPRIGSLSPKWKLAISLWILLHLFAIIAEPFALFTRGADGYSPTARPLRRGLAPYVEFGYLHHGYFFFAPNPAPSHLLECSLKSSSGEQSRLRLPDRRAQWPRLLYHRHFMLAEFLNQFHVEPVTEQGISNLPNKELQDAWRSDRARFEMVRDSMIKHLKHRYHVDSAEIFRLEHRLPSAAEVFEGKIPLDDERFYVVLPDAPVYDPPVTTPELISGESNNSNPILNSPLDASAKGQP